MSACYFRNLCTSSFVPFALAPLALLLSGAVTAADQHTQHLQLAPVVLTAVAPSSPLTVVTDPKQPRQPVPAADGADYLKTIPGFSAVGSGGTNSDPVFRGQFGSRLNILSDGGQMLGACPNRMDAPTSYLSPENFDRITVIKGPQSVLWGPGASAATVLFERETEPFEQLGGRVNGSILAGSNGRFDRRLDATAGGSQGYIRLLANKAQADDYEDGNGDNVPSRWQKWNTDLLLGWTPNADTLIELSAGRGDGEARYAGRGMDGSQFLRESLALRVRLDNLGEVLQSVEGRVYYNYADHVMDNFSLRSPNRHDAMAMMRNPMATNVDRRTLGARVVGTWQWQQVELKAGVDAQSNEHRKRSSSFDMLTDTYHDYDEQAYSKDAEMHNYGGFGELTWSLNEQQRWIFGARLDRASAKDFRQTLGSGMMQWRNPNQGYTRSETLPSGFFRYEQDLHSIPATWYAGVGHTQRFPDYWEFFSASPGAMGSSQPIESLNPEKTTQLDLGINYKSERLEAWASAYAGQVRDYILFSYQSGMMPGMSTSSASNIDARIMGGELGASYAFTSNWKGDASLAYAWGKNSSDGRPLPQTPPLEARLGLAYERNDWSTAALWRVVSAQHRIDQGKGNVAGKDLDKSGGFAVFSLNAAYRLSHDVKVSAGVDNLFDKTYSEHLNLAGNAGFGFIADDPQRFNEPGRTLWTKLDFSF
jgi:iron complex outermembrane receptor protein